MTLKEFDLGEENHFVAMEYYNLILNRTYLILLTKQYLIGIKANGMISIEGGGDIFTKQITRTSAVRGDLNNPYSYLKENYIRNIENDNLLDKTVLLVNKSNFMIDRSDIKTVYYNPRKKWGMGYYPHDGKVYVKTNDNKEREFIILGNQSGKKIASLIMQ
ncbi:hypothetical protein [uncultured Hymenobacter sp.]|uniref:hypothetical protein n=1 Tax=uncultured Hymenobacter sp. TaxID=170016 RepID=UPI0035CA205F